MCKYLQKSLSLVFVLISIVSQSVTVANASDKKGDHTIKSKEHSISIVIRIDGDDVDVSTTGIAGSDKLSKSIRQQIETALAGAVGDASDKERDTKESNKKIVIMRSVGGEAGLENADKSLVLQQLGDSDRPRAIVVRQVAETSEEPSHRIGVMIAGTAGLLVSDVADGSPAKEAGIHGGDVVLSVDGELVGDVSQLIDGVQSAGKEGKSLNLRVIRGNETRTVKVAPAPTNQERPESDDSDSESEHRMQTRKRVEHMPAELQQTIEKAIKQRREAETRMHHHRIAQERELAGSPSPAAAIRELRIEVQRLREEVRELKRASRLDEARD